MADISGYIDAINKAVRGEEVRSAIIEAMKLINNNNEARTLNGIPAERFATKDDIDRILPLDIVPTKNSTRGVTSGGIYDYVYNTLGDALRRVLYNNEREGTDKAIVDLIQELVDIKKDIKYAIKSKDIEVPDETVFSDYDDLIREISGANINLSELTITDLKDEEYDAGTGKGYNPVKVKINWDNNSLLVDKDIIGSSIEDPTENTEFTIANDPRYKDTPEKDKPKGYKKVTINVSDKIGPKDDIEVDKNFPEVQVIKASDFDLFGFNQITITVKENTGPFTVRFYSDASKSQLMATVTVEVPGQTAFYPGVNDPEDEQYSHGKVFSGWNPEPIDVRRDMDCIAIYKDKKKTSYTGEIPDTWDQIVLNGGSDGYEVGSWKVLKLKSFTYTDAYEAVSSTVEATMIPSRIIMQKVFEGTEGSIWMSRTPLPNLLCCFDNPVEQRGSGVFYGYKDSFISKFLNETLYNAIDRSEEYGQANLISHIKSVRKNICCWDKDEIEGMINGNPSNPNYSALSPTGGHFAYYKIWLPSAYEMTGKAAYKDEDNLGEVYAPNGNLPAFTDPIPSGFTAINQTILRSGSAYIVIKGQVKDDKHLYRAFSSNTNWVEYKNGSGSTSTATFSDGESIAFGASARFFDGGSPSKISSVMQYRYFKKFIYDDYIAAPTASVNSAKAIMESKNIGNEFGGNWQGASDQKDIMFCMCISNNAGDA